MARILMSTLLSALVLLGSGIAQEKKSDRQTDIERKIAKMREMLRKGKIVRSHVQVTVRLENGNKLEGVVKDGRLIERVDGLRFVAAEAGAKDAGIRLWYSDGTTSYIFVPYRSVKSYWVGRRLDDDQVKAIETDIEEKQAKARADYRAGAAERRKARAERLARIAEARKGGGTPDGGEKDEDAAEEKRLLALLEEFPPSAGWGPEKKKQIEMRKVVVGAFPDEKEKRFLEKYADWQKALRLAAKKAVGGEKKGGTPEGQKKNDPSGEQKGDSGSTGPTPGVPPRSGG